MSRQYVPFSPVGPNIHVAYVNVPQLFERRVVTELSQTVFYDVQPALHPGDAAAYLVSVGGASITQVVSPQPVFHAPLSEWVRDPLGALIEIFVGGVRPVNGDDPILAQFSTSLGIRTPNGTYRLHYSQPIGVHLVEDVTGRQGAIVFNQNCAVVSPD